MRRILLLIAADSWEDAEEAVRSARESARRPQALSFGLPLQREPDAAALEAMRTLGTLQYLTPARSPWEAVEELWQGEDHVMVAHPGIRFLPRWDERLFALLPDGHSALTGCPPLAWDAVQAMAPLAADRAEDGRLLLRRGIPIPDAARPLHCAFLNPDFCFAPVLFFREMGGIGGDPSLRASALRWDLYTLNEPLAQMTRETAVSPLPLAVPDGWEAEADRFDRRFGVRREDGALTAQARTGIWSPEMGYPVKPSAAVAARNRLRRAAVRSKASPLCVTVFAQDAGEPEESVRERLRHFRYAADLRNLALLVYAPGRARERILRYHPNVLDYTARCMMPQTPEIPASGLPVSERVALGKVFTLAQAAERIPSSTHLVWLDFAALPCRFPPDTVPDWDLLCTDRIAMAAVNGMPDPCMIVVPAPLLDEVQSGWLSVCREAVSRDHVLPAEEELWARLAEAHPEWFTLHELSLPHELFTLVI